MTERLSKYDKSRQPPESPFVQKAPDRLGEPKPKAEIQVIVDRLSIYDKSVYPPASPEVKKSVVRQGEAKSKAEIDGIVERLTPYDAKVYPPESGTFRKPIGYGRWDHFNGPEPDRGPKISTEKMEEIVERLTTAPEKKEDTPKPSKKKFSSDEVSEIFERLQKCDFAKGPPDSRLGRKYLGYFRYSYSETPSRQGPFAPTEKINEIVARLSQYDISKYPPDSRGHEKKA